MKLYRFKFKGAVVIVGAESELDAAVKMVTQLAEDSSAKGQQTFEALKQEVAGMGAAMNEYLAGKAEPISVSQLGRAEILNYVSVESSDDGLLLWKYVDGIIYGFFTVNNFEQHFVAGVNEEGIIQALSFSHESYVTPETIHRTLRSTLQHHCNYVVGKVREGVKNFLYDEIAQAHHRQIVGHVKAEHVH